MHPRACSLLLCFLLGTCVGCGGERTAPPGDKPPSSDKKNTTNVKDKDTKLPIAVVEGPGEVAAARLSKAFLDDASEAGKKYGDAKTTVVGIVKDISVAKDGAVDLTLAGESGGPDITCNTFSDPKSAADVKKGQKVKVSGTCFGKQGQWVLFGNCKIVE